MDTNRRPQRSLTLYLLILLVVFGVYWFLMGRKPAVGEDYTYREFVSALEDGKVAEVSIRPNTQVPTGQVVIRFQDDSIARFYDTDVNAIQKMLLAIEASFCN